MDDKEKRLELARALDMAVGSVERERLELARELYEALGAVGPLWAEEIAGTTVGEGRFTDNEWGDRWWAAVRAAWEAQHPGVDLTMAAQDEQRAEREAERERAARERRELGPNDPLLQPPRPIPRKGR